MTYNFKHFNPTGQQRDNLTTLLDVLSNPERMHALAPTLGFDMGNFVVVDYAIKDRPFDYERYTYKDVIKCNTSACAAGWGVVAGIEKLEDESWGQYCSRQYGTSTIDDIGFQGDDSFSFLFGGMRSNSIEAAAARIRIILNAGIPCWDIDTGDIDLANALIDGRIKPVYFQESTDA